ncbi:ATPase, T2SS/T4P/T4SS family [Anaeromicropila populeti]|uniref:Pilus assembly protein CpaF n=1 Tax=Anaeromicropila populeti TaxID=37658 RepID=A0A1I6JFD6_9FIRM|nr:ATPase, T2SS/T4P/T4SS family [Anaeromicropila populeti]SFR77691.1 pilus assembly protein CpaF [Anaeromicropila populeti]
MEVKNVIDRSDTKQMEFPKLFVRTQKHMSKNCSILIDAIDKNKKDSNAMKQLENYIRKYLQDRKLVAEDMTLDETVKQLINEMTQFSILNEYLDPGRSDIEEININAWDDVKVSYSDGRIERAAHFYSPKHCEDIIRKLLRQESKITFDKSRPIVRSHLNENIRITVIGGECVDRAVGLAASIRIINPKHFRKEDFVQKGTITEEMLNLLTALFLNGVSMCVTGETGSGKTTIMSYLLEQIPYHKRVITIEEDVREFTLVRRNEKGEVQNNVIHMVTKKSEDMTLAVDQEKLLETAMTMNPDFICVAEMKGKEALAAQEAANTGHTVVTTTHARSCRLTYDRMASLCKNGNDDSKTLVNMAKNAFPIVIFIKKYPDNVRRVEEMTECIMKENGTCQINTLYQFVVKKNTTDEAGRIRLEGIFEKKNNISQYMQKVLKEGAVDSQLIKNIMEG